MKYTGSKCRLCRREAVKLFLKGDKCVSQKCPLRTKNFPPGQHKKMFGSPTEYARQLREKQKAKRMYNIAEKQFSLYYTKASKKKGVNTGDLLLTFLESRLDNILYRAGLADSRSQARQMVSHGLLRVNGRKVTIPSIQLFPGDEFEVVTRMKNSPLFANKQEKKEESPTWLTFDFKTLKGAVERSLETADLPAEIDAQLIVEYYSR
jgi:small subunit ribosomal protein S4